MGPKLNEGTNIDGQLEITRLWTRAASIINHYACL
jgi:hypothetical protein